MIKFVTGKPGGGKSLRTMRLIVDEISKGEKGRPIVTNLPLKLFRLAAYAEDKGYKYDVLANIKILRVETLGIKYSEYLGVLRKFYMYRGKLTPEPDPKSGEELTLPSGSILYIIDEIHKLWPAQGWLESKGDRVFEYLAEHRHFGDDVVFVTQALAQVNKQIRILGQDFEVVRNRGKEKIKWFAGPKKFRVYVYLSAPTGANNQTPAEVWEFRLDDLADLYSTSAKGGDADKGRYAKGIPYWTIVPALILFTVVMWAVTTQGPRLLAGRFTAQGQGKSMVLPPDGVEKMLNDNQGSENQMQVEYQPLYVRGFYASPTSCMIFLSNGQKITERDPRLEAIDMDFIVYDGQVIPLLGK